MTLITLDFETVGFHGVGVLLQWAEDNGPINLHSIWSVPIRETLQLIEKIVEHPGGVVLFNGTFDWFHLCKIYNILRLYKNHDVYPEDIIDELAELELEARDGPCLKPVKACDVMLVARKGKYQSTMNRGDINIRRVPTPIAFQLADELDRRIKFKDIYFARKKDKTRWQVVDIEAEGEIDKNFKNVVLKFAPSSALKTLAVDALGLPPEDVLRFTDISVDKVWNPVEFGYAPFARAAGGEPGDWKGAWPECIRHHIAHWNYHETAREYAAMDVDYTRRLYYHFGSPPLGDDDSELACMVAAVRWKGFHLDMPKLKELRFKAKQKIGNIPMHPDGARRYVSELLSPTEKLILKGSTKRVLLEEIAGFRIACKCSQGVSMEIVEEKLQSDILDEVMDITQSITKMKVQYAPDKDCIICGGKGHLPHPGAGRAQEVLDARKATKEIENYDKLIRAGRLHASFKIIGTLSSRMAGTDDLNSQGIKKSKDVRSCFPLAGDGMVLCGGDYAGFEVTLAEASYHDPDLRKDLLTCENCSGDMVWKPEVNDFICTACGSNKGKKIHALFGIHVFPEMTYEEIKATDGTADDKYTRCKQAVFALFYGGEGKTLQDRLGVDLETADTACAKFMSKYKQVGISRKVIFDMFCSMRQPNGIGSRVEWHEPKDYIESMFGFRRYFTLENQICKALFELAEKPPKHWKEIKIRVMRRDRVQLAEGATRSAVFAGAFNLQASNMRAAANHVIQSSGAQITKAAQRAIWDIQPSGVHSWRVQSMNIHDEILCVTHPDYVDLVEKTIKASVEKVRPIVPLIKIEWNKNMKTWAEK